MRVHRGTYLEHARPDMKLIDYFFFNVYMNYIMRIPQVTVPKCHWFLAKKYKFII